METNTPWRRVYKKFGMSGNALAKEIGRDRSKISRELSSERGLINGEDQELLLAAAARLGVDLTADDMFPVR